MSVLYLTEQNASVRLDDQTLLVTIPEDKPTGRDKRKVRVPLGKVNHVVVMGNITLTTPALSALIDQRVEVVYLTRWGKFVGRLCGDDHRHGQLRLLQRRSHDDPTAALHVARMCVRSKLHNQRTLLLRSNRERGDSTLQTAADQIGSCIEAIDALPNEDVPAPDPTRPQAGTVLGQVMGYEGLAANAYFEVFGSLFNPQWAERFHGRHKRPPTDPINALLSFGYTLLTNQMTGAAHIVGFDPYVGYLHSSQYGRPALSCDLVEMFRTPIVESVVLTLLNNRMLDIDDFEEVLGAWWLADKGRRVFLTRYEERLNETITHPVFKTKVTYRRALELQMRLLSRWLLGEFKRFRGFAIR
ncbi:MAG: CRISPR-associated endonuclease Cas1 [Anaerolineae bacterium]|nr:CRISPR-associated endonuclease Cas1 [Anaerolineae bacterium]